MPSIYSKVCSKHFRTSDFVSGMNKRRLTLTAVPTIFHGHPENSQTQETNAAKQKKSTNNVAALCSGVKQEFIEIELIAVNRQNCTQATSTPAGAGGVIVDQDVFIKDELGDTDLSTEPSVHMEPCYKINQEMNAAKQESSTNNGNDTALCRGVKQEFIEIELMDAGLDTYICDYCEKMFTRKSRMALHITHVHASGSYKCNQCGKPFKCKLYLKLHKVNMHSILRKECDVCGKLYKQSYMKKHMLLVHSNKTTQCMFCGKIMISKRFLHFHINHTHSHQSIGSPFVEKCVYCQKIYLKDSINTHMRYKHDNTFNHRCPECKLGFESAGCLLRHINLVHSKEHQVYNQQSTCSNSVEKISESTHSFVGEMNTAASASAQQHDSVVMKEEPPDEELELGPVMFQHMDSNYRLYKEEPLLD